MFGKYEWVSEVDKSMWCSTCKPLQNPALFESNEVFQCYMKANQLCFTHRERVKGRSCGVSFFNRRSLTSSYLYTSLVSTFHLLSENNSTNKNEFCFCELEFTRIIGGEIGWIDPSFGNIFLRSWMHCN